MWDSKPAYIYYGGVNLTEHILNVYFEVCELSEGVLHSVSGHVGYLFWDIR